MEPFSNMWIILLNPIFVLCENFEKFSLDFFYLEDRQNNIFRWARVNLFSKLSHKYGKWFWNNYFTVLMTGNVMCSYFLVNLHYFDFQEWAIERENKNASRLPWIELWISLIFERKYLQFSVAPTWLKRTEHDTCGMAPVFEMFNHAEDNNAFFDFDKINKKLYVAAIKERVCRTHIGTSESQRDFCLPNWFSARNTSRELFKYLRVCGVHFKGPLKPGQGYRRRPASFY